MAAFLLDPAVVRPDEAGMYQQFIDRAVGQASPSAIDRARLLDDLPRLSTPSYAPLAALHTLLCQLPGQWPVLHLQRCYVEFWTGLPEEAKAGRAPTAAQKLLDAALKQCKTSYSSLIDLYHPASNDAAIIDPQSGRAVHHNGIASTVGGFALPLPALVHGRKPVVAISLPNGPLLALTVLSTATYYTAAPLAHGNGVGAEQFRTDVLQSRSNMVIASPNDVERLGLRQAWLADAGIPVLLAELTDALDLTLRKLDGTPVNNDNYNASITAPATRPLPNVADDIGIMLFTSGTSGTKKLVPLSVHSMVCGVAMVVRSWGLSPSMRCLNQMPLNHVGGLIRNLFAPVMSGGSVICCSAFDANLFWDCVEDHAPTWYYASPSMHQGILEAGIDRPESMAKSEIRLVCNAAGGLLPSLAVTLRDTFSTDRFDCTVLPSYGMTECMPISTPPLDYRLDRTGTSGVSVGPEIAILDGCDKVEGVGEIGRICVRGAPVFGGYLRVDNVIDTSCFTDDGWFDTGDMGYLDREGYLYITGRSKEVINRGGELISPFEVEEAIVAAACKPDSPIFGRISRALAFSVAHDVLQEVVGIAVVTPEQAPRACLRGIQQAVKSVLNQVKIPVVVVYMHGGLPTNNNKVLRIRLAERLGLREVSDNTPHSERYYEAVCPPANTPLGVNIKSTPLDTTHDAVAEACKPVLPKHVEFHIRPDASDFYPELILAPRKDSTITVDDSTLSGLTQSLSKDLHGYHMPLKVMRVDVPLPRNPFGDVDDDMLSSLLRPKKHAAAGPVGGADQNTTEGRVAAIFAQILSVSEGDVNGRSDFFDLGGNSMAAGRLLSALRKEFNLRLPIDALFTNRQVGELARLINEKLGREDPHAVEQGVASETSLLPGCEKTCSSTNPALMFLQLLPIGLLFPMKRALTWTVFMYFLTFTQGWVTNNSIPGRLLDLVVSMTVGRLVTKTVAPLFAIAFKWLVVGRHEQGLYPMWGSYHTRWWMTEKVVCICGLGLFAYFDWSRVLYYRMLGAKIGRNVSINKGASLGEWDLISIGDNVVLERCTVRPFAAERNTSMYLGKISIGHNCSVGLCSIVAAGTSLPDNACIGPNSSSWEASDADEANRDLAASKIPEAHWLLQIVLGLPLFIITNFVGLVPWLGCLIALVRYEPGQAVYDELRVIIVWFASPTRVAFHYSALAANVSLGPIFFFLAFLVVKRTLDFFCGKITPGSVEGRSAMTTFRRQLYNRLMPAPQFHKATGLFGVHYATTSVFARALGAKVGKRVYWPGTGPSVQDWDLLDIGDDVVFGSRSHMVTSDGTGSDFVRVGSGAMVADRVVLLPGVELGEKVVMGSGAMTKRNKSYAAGSTWVGSKHGEAVCLTVDTGSPTSPTTQELPTPNYSSYNSSNSTLVKAAESGRSSIDAIEAGHGKSTYAFPGEKKEDDDMNIKVSEKFTGSSASSTINTTTTTTTNESSSPFGRAFYQGKASYRVWGQVEIFIYSTLITVLGNVYWNVGSISAVQIVGHLFRTDNPILKHFLAQHFLFRPLSLYIFFLSLIVGIMAAQTIVVIAGTILAKWVIMGRRQQGNYDWDKSSYCQRWQLFLKLETFRRQCYGGHGILGLLTGTAWLSLYFRALGADIGAHCALFASGAPNLMFTEPDLLTLGERVSVDDASLVAHINSRGKFDLNPLHVGARSVLRSGSRLLSGARMEEDACLLEHTLVMAGDVIDPGVCAQGWPAGEFGASRMPTLEVARVWKVKA